MIDVVEILQHWHAGRAKSVIASSVGVDAKTVRKYVAAAEAAGMAPGGPPLERAAWAALVAGWFAELVDARARSLTFPLIEPHRERIEEMRKTNTGCAHLFWPHLSRLCSSGLAPPGLRLGSTSAGGWSWTVGFHGQEVEGGVVRADP